MLVVMYLQQSNCYINLYHMVKWAVILKICSFFYREHHPFYESFLSTVVGKDETRHKVSKTIDNLFKLLSSLLNKQVNYRWGIGQKLLINYWNDRLFVITVAVVNCAHFRPFLQKQWPISIKLRKRPCWKGFLSYKMAK